MVFNEFTVVTILTIFALLSFFSISLVFFFCLSLLFPTDLFTVLLFVHPTILLAIVPCVHMFHESDVSFGFVVTLLTTELQLLFSFLSFLYFLHTLIFFLVVFLTLNFLFSF